MKQSFSVVSLFSGAGGLDMGLKNAGFNIIWANDIDRDSCDTHKNWSDAEVFCGDITNIDVNIIPDANIIVGGFPCQGFSLAGPRKINDQRNKLYRNFVEVVREKQPLVFIAENVKGILTLGKGTILDAIVKDFERVGYRVSCKLLNAKNYKVPQNRQRVFFIGIRKDLDYKFVFPKGYGKKVTLREALADLPNPKPHEICNEPYSSRYMSRNRRRSWDNVSYTIPAMAKQVTLHPSSPKMIKIGRDQWAFGEGQTRRFSWREAAVIQTFPQDLEFAGNLTSKYRQIGNAVPVKLAEEIGFALMDSLTTEFANSSQLVAGYK